MISTKSAYSTQLNNQYAKYVTGSITMKLYNIEYRTTFRYRYLLQKPGIEPSLLFILFTYHTILGAKIKKNKKNRISVYVCILIIRARRFVSRGLSQRGYVSNFNAATVALYHRQRQGDHSVYKMAPNIMSPLGDMSLQCLCQTNYTNLSG